MGNFYPYKGCLVHTLIDHLKFWIILYHKIRVMKQISNTNLESKILSHKGWRWVITITNNKTALFYGRYIYPCKYIYIEFFFFF